jgi:hypothetical protein
MGVPTAFGSARATTGGYLDANFSRKAFRRACNHGSRHRVGNHGSRFRLRRDGRVGGRAAGGDTLGYARPDRVVVLFDPRLDSPREDRDHADDHAERGNDWRHRHGSVARRDEQDA